MIQKMNRLLIILSILLIYLSCEKRDLSHDGSLVEFTKENYLIIGDTTYCSYLFGNPIMSIESTSNSRKYDSIDIDTNGTYDLTFYIHNYENDCSDFYCDSGDICDCWETWSKYQAFKNTGTFQIAYDTDSLYPLCLLERDTLTDSRLWIIKDINCLQDYYFGTYYTHEGHWIDEDFGFIGIRKIENNDTCYGWIYMEHTGSSLRIEKIALQKND
jgi:hypothetical protein